MKYVHLFYLFSFSQAPTFSEPQIMVFFILSHFSGNCKVGMLTVEMTFCGLKQKDFSSVKHEIARGYNALIFANLVKNAIV